MSRPTSSTPRSLRTSAWLIAAATASTVSAVVPFAPASADSPTSSTPPAPAESPSDLTVDAPVDLPVTTAVDLSLEPQRDPFGLREDLHAHGSHADEPLVEVVTPSGTVVEIPESVALDDRADVTDAGIELSQPGLSTPLLPPALLHQIANAQYTSMLAPGISETDGAHGGTHESNAASAESPPASAAFDLSSLPGASKTLYLDFDGHTTTGTYWNSGTNSDGSPRPETIVSAPYSTDGDPNFSNSELESIVKIWEMVAEDFAPFNVNVTTIDPGVEALRDTGDTEYGVRTVISPSSEWYGSAGGVAVVGSFDSYQDTPAFVFSDALGGGYWKFVGEATSHEIGHTFGLYHDGGPNSSGQTLSYYEGHGSGANGWAPIMGVGYQKAITQWSKGDYSGATQTQDDVQIITDEVGLAPNSLATGVGPQTVPYNASLVGVAPTAGASAEFEVAVGDGTTIVAVTPINGSGNLLARLDIVQGSTIIDSRTASAATGWILSSSQSLPAGTYTIRITSVAWLTPDTGFPSYASIGEFSLDINAPAPPSGATTTTTTTTTPSSGTQPPTSDPTDTPTTSTPTTTAPPTTNPPVAERPTGDRLTPISPQRLLDTRSGRGGSTRLAAGQTARVRVAGVDEIAPDASAAVLTVTAVKPADEGYLAVTPCVPHDPNTSTSTLNFVANGTVANTSIVKLDGSGDVCVYAAADTDVLIDATAWLGDGGSSALTTRTPERIVDSRDGTGLTGKLVGGTTAVIDLSALVSPSATAVAANITVTATEAGGFVTVFPCAAGRGDTSSVNFGAFEARANNVVVAIDRDDTICVYTDATAHIIVDLRGEFAEDGLTFIPATPERVVDSRGSMFRVPAQTGASYTVPTPEGFELGDVAAASINITAIRQTERGFVTAWNCGVRPDSSALNPLPGEANANGVIARVADDGRSCLFTEEAAALIVDLTGWWV